MKRLFFVLSLIVSITSILFALPVQAQSTAAVSIFAASFSPTPLTVPINTTVTWTNMSDLPHTTASNSGQAVSWSSPVLDRNQTFSFNFSTAGTFNYTCTIHGFSGSIIVQAASQATAT